MITSFYHDDGTLETSISIVMKNYLESWFIVDFLASFPFEPIL